MTKILNTKTEIKTKYNCQQWHFKAVPRRQDVAGRFYNQNEIPVLNSLKAEGNESRSDAGSPVSNVSANIRPLSDYSGHILRAILSDGVEENDFYTLEEPVTSFGGRPETANWNQRPSVEITDLRTDQPLTSETLGSELVLSPSNNLNIEHTGLSLESLNSRVVSLEGKAKDGFKKLAMLESRVGKIEIDVGSIKRTLENTRKR